MSLQADPESEVLPITTEPPRATAWIHEHSPRNVWRAVFREDNFFLVLSVFIGVFSGLAVVCFRYAIDWARLYLLGTGAVLTPARLLLAPTLAGLVIAVLVIHFFPRTRGSGVNQTKAALYIYNGYISFRTAIGKFITAALAIGSRTFTGAGRSLAADRRMPGFGDGPKDAADRATGMRLIAPVGAAAGLAAAFNAPISAVLFVIEEVIGRWTAGILGSVVLSAISSVVVMRWFLGSESMFRIPAVRDDRAVGVAGVRGAGRGRRAGGGGILAAGFGILRPRLQGAAAMDAIFSAGDCGVVASELIALLGAPQVMGAGYEYIDQAMHGQFTWQFLAILAGLKIVATLLSFVSGTPGGMFAPTLFIGAMLGAAVGRGGALHVSAPDDLGWDLCAGGHGSAVCGIPARSDDIGIHGAGGQRELFHHRAGDPGEHIRVCDLARAAADCDF